MADIKSSVIDSLVLKETEQFVEMVLTEIFGQRATLDQIQATARRIVKAFPARTPSNK